METEAVGSSPTNEYRELAEQIRLAGLLKRRPWYYSLKIGSTITAFAAGWVALFLVGNSWAALGIAVFLAVMFTQVLFIGHDSGHQQIFRSRRGNWLVGLLVGNALTGLSYGWWVPKHSAHHSHPNQIGRDPDIGVGAVGLGTVSDVGSHSGARARLVRLWHGVTFAPFIFLELGMHLSSFRELAKRRDRGALLEGLLLTLHAALYLTAVFWLLSPLRAIAFIALQQGVFGVYLRMSFAPNHKGMPIVQPGAQMSFIQRQVSTARNVTGGRFLTFMLGGLNYQIEHHLFPTMPRPNLVRAQSIVRAFCAEHNVTYCEDTLIGSYRQAIRWLRSPGTAPEPLEPAPVASPPQRQRSLTGAQS